MNENDFVIEKDTLCLYRGMNTDAIIPDGVRVISSGAFRKCRNLISVTIPDSVTEIENGAFSECYNLTNVIIGNNVKVIT